MKKNYSKELDYILAELVISYDNHFKGFVDNLAEPHKTTKGIITQKLKDNFELKDWEINLQFEKLLKDAYIKSIEPLEISMEGLVYNNKGGYTKKRITNKHWMTLLTVLITIGTLVAAWYYGTELWKYYHNK